jgi:hypothetical protein
MAVGRLADVVLPEDLRDRGPRLPLLQDADDLALGFRMGVSLAPESLPSNCLPGGEAYGAAYGAASATLHRGLPPFECRGPCREATHGV